MKIILALIALTCWFCAAVCAQQKTTADNNAAQIALAGGRGEELPPRRRANNKTPVLVELFTSEGCATCPPAERNLAILEREQPSAEAEIITLALHVDYWNRLGWTDRFSSPLFSQRQGIYGSKFKLGSTYTPQMIVDGSRHFVGHNLGEAQKVIGEAAKTPKAKIELSQTGDNLKIKVSGMPKHEAATLMLAIAEDDITTEVKRGENGGRTLHHTSVVRRLQPLGRLLPSENEFEFETALNVEADWKKGNLKIVVFVQENQSRKILGVSRKLL